MVLSAKNESGLKNYARKVHEHLSSQAADGFMLDTVASTLVYGREEFDKRLAIVASSIDEYIQKLKDFCSGVAEESEGIFAGTGVRKNQEALYSLPDADYSSKNFTEIARLWVNGAKIQWDKLIARKQVVSLPGYCFEENRYWVLDHYQSGTISKIHYLIDSNQSTLLEQKFKKCFTGEERFFQDHSIGKNHVLPGVVSLEMARTAAQLANDQSVVKEIRHFEWNKPVVLKSDKLELFTEFGVQKGRVYTSVYSIHNGMVENHAQGEIVYGESGSESIPEKIDIHTLKNALPNTVLGEECYQRLSRLGLNIGPSLRSIKKLHIGKGAILAELCIEYGNNFDFYVHPSLLDGSIQSIIGLSTQDDHVLHIPYSIEKIRYLAPIKGAAYAYLRITGSSNRDMMEKTVDIDILSEDGRIAVQINKLTIKPFMSSYDRVEAEVITSQQQWVESNVQTELDVVIHKRMVVIAENSDSQLYKQMAEELKNNRFEVVFLPLNSMLTDNFTKLCSAGEIPDVIFYLQGGHTDQPLGFEDVSKVKTSFLTLFAFVKHILSSKTNIPFYFISTSALYSGVEPFLRTASDEAGFFVFKYIELLSHGQIHDVIKENATLEYNLPIRFQDGKRYVKRMIPCSLPQSKNTIFENGQVYLITGGLGEIGQRLAEYILERYACSLVLIGRSQLSGEKEEVLKRLNRLNPNAKAVYKSCDITDLQALDLLLHSIRAEYKHIDGILHLAGSIKDALIINKSAESMNLVLDPKMIGTVLLDMLTQKDALQFFLCFSSISGVNGNFGQSDYAFANGFMDAYLQIRNTWVEKGIRSGRAYSINWPYWEEGGMELSADVIDSLRQKYGIQPLKSQEGLMLLDGLKEAPTSMIVLYGNKQKATSLLAKEKVKTNVQNEVKPAQIAAVENQLEEQLIIMFANIQRIDVAGIKPTVALSSYGLESISMSEYTRLLAKTFSIDLKPSVFFEVNDIRSLAKYLLENYRETFLNYYHAGEYTGDAEPVENFRAPVVDVENKPLVTSLFKNNFRFDSQMTEVVKEPVAIIGISGILPSSENLDEFWKALEGEQSLIRVVPSSRWDWEELYGNPRTDVNKTNIKWGGFVNSVDEFDAQFFGISPREAELMDPQQRLFLQVVWEAIENAGYKASDLAGTKTGLFVGVGNFDYSDLLKDRGIPIDSYAATGIAHSILANRISYLLNLKGPSEPTDTACSSSLVSIHHAIEAISLGYCDLAIAGGVNLILNANMTISFNKAGMLSEDGRCKTFDKDANGYVRGEGTGAVVLKPLSQAMEDGDYIHAVILGSSVNHGGKVNSLTVPNPLAQAEVIKDAFERAGVSANTVSYIEAHGTGTPLGDPVEIQGLKYAFKTESGQGTGDTNLQPYCGIGSVKTNVGHLETAAGIAGILKVVLALSHRKIPASINFHALNPYIDLSNSPFYIVNKTKDWTPLYDSKNQPIPRRAGVSSFGFGGVNAHIVLEEYENKRSATKGGVIPQLFILSAQTEEQVVRYAKQLEENLEDLKFIEEDEVTLLNRIAYTFQTGREEKEYRLAVIASSLNELKEELSHFVHHKANTNKTFFQKVASSNLFILDWDEADEVVERIIQKRDLVKISRLWLNGVTINWKALFDGMKPQRIPLPTYPFQRTITKRKKLRSQCKDQEG